MYGKLTEKEYGIMKYIWDNPEGVTFNEIFTYANMGDAQSQKQTINTHLRHLIEKGFVKVEGEDRRHLYYPIVPRAEYDNMLAEHVVEQLFDGSLKNFIAALTSNKSLTSREVSELKALIRRRG